MAFKTSLLKVSIADTASAMHQLAMHIKNLNGNRRELRVNSVKKIVSAIHQKVIF